MRYGFIGLGELGLLLARNLIKGGLSVKIYDQRDDPVQQLVGLGGIKADSVADCASGVDALITCLPSPAATKAVLDAVIAAAPKSLASWIEMGTNEAKEIESLAARLKEFGIETLAAPVTGGVHLAASAKIAVLAGGDEALFERHRPALSLMGNRIFHLGGIEQAAVTKVVTNMLAFIHLIAAGEAMMLCKQAGVDMTQAFEAIKASSGNSFVHETETQVVLNGSYDIGFTLDLAKKDSGFATAFGAKYGVPLRLASAMEQAIHEASAKYGGDAWSPMVIKLLEDAVGESLRADGFPARLPQE
ncbi:MAG: NAD(P)-dependent oxidoreductase [Alphaproteobacteria bacterium]